MQLLQPEIPKNPKMVDDMALSSIWGSTQKLLIDQLRLDTLLIIKVMILPAIDDKLTGMRTRIPWIPDSLERESILCFITMKSSTRLESTARILCCSLFVLSSL